MDNIDINEIAAHANFSAVARLDADQYTILVTCMTQWADEHSDQAEEIRTLKSIEFIRER